MSLLEKLGLKRKEEEIVTVKRFTVNGYKSFAGKGDFVGSTGGRIARAAGAQIMAGGEMVRIEPYTSLQHYLDQIALLRLTGSATECGFEAYVKEHVNTHGGRGGDANHENDCQKHTRIYLLPPGNTTVILNPNVCAGHMKASIELRCQGKEPDYLPKLIADIGGCAVWEQEQVSTHTLNSLIKNRHGFSTVKGHFGIMYQR